MGCVRRWLCLACGFGAALLVPLLPYLVNGAPLLGDSWLHVDIAGEVARSGRYSFEGYSEGWPLVNLLLALLAQVTGLSTLRVGVAVPVLAGLASIPLYATCRKLGLSRAASSASLVFLSFNPLYSYVTFTGGVMKETAAFYLVVLVFMLGVGAVKRPASGAHAATALILGLGVALGHHYGGLVTTLYAWALVGYALLDGLRGGSTHLGNALALAVALTLPFSAWNAVNYTSLGAFFPVFNPSDALLLLAILLLAWASLLGDEGVFSARRPWLTALAYLAAVAGLRTTLYLLAQPVPPISVYEVRDLCVSGGLALAAFLARGMRGVGLRALGAAAVAMVVFATLWGTTYPGYVLLIKSLHYYGPLLAVGAGFTAHLILRRGRGWMGGVLTLALLGFTVTASLTGTHLALSGLSAYTHPEVEGISRLPLPTAAVVYGDTRMQYLLPYTSDIQPSGLRPLQEMGAGSLLILSQSNLRNGFLRGYDWLPLEEVVTHPLGEEWSRVYHSQPIQVWLR